MTYSSLIFASVILPVSVLFLFFDRSSEYKNLCLCITSLLFVTWGHNILAALMFLTLFVDYLFALAVEGSMKRDKSRAVVFLLLDLVMNAGILVFLGHSELFSEESGLRLNEIYVPVGAAFYSIKNFSYVYDVFTGRCKAERSPFYILTYGMSYPFLLAGPVVRYGDIAPQLRDRKLTVGLLSSGIKSFAVGFVKTIVAVPVLKSISDAGLYAEGAAGIGSAVGMLAWLCMMWFAFTGMSDMGTGIARLNGFDVPLNYRRLTAKHMLGGAVKCCNTSLIEFAEDIRGEGAKSAVLTVVLAVCAAVFYSGNLMYIVVGLVVGIILAGEYLFAYDRIEEFPAPVKAVLTFIAAYVLFSPLAFDSFGKWTGWATGILSSGGETTSNVLALLQKNLLILILCFVSMSPIGEMLKRSADRIAERSRGAYTAVRVTEAVLTAAALAVGYILLAANTAAV